MNIELLTDSELLSLDGQAGRFAARVKKRARYVDLAKCTSCNECANVCPVELPNEYDEGLALKKAAYKKYPQAIPGAFAIQKEDKAPCRLACPAGLNVQGYVQMVKEGKYQQALSIIMEDLPLPGILGRICPHGCEDACRRCDVDEPVAIEALVDEALLRRFDVAAARYRRGAAGFLAKGAAFDIKRRVDLQMGVGYAGLYEGGDTTKFDDLATGWWKAVSDFSAGPSFRIGVTFELPVANRVARGRSVQAHGLQQQSWIEVRDLERTVANEIERLTGALQRAIDEGRRRGESVRFHEEALASDTELYRAGEGSSIDVILTQERLVAQEIQLVSARRTIALLATQLSFEIGQLVDCQIAGEKVTVVAYHPHLDLASLTAAPSPAGRGSGNGSE